MSKMLKSQITTKKPATLLHNPTPGDILLQEFLEPMGLSQNAVARAIHVSPRRVNEIVLGKRSITADTDLRLTRYFGLSEGYFMGLQTDHDLLEQKRKLGAVLQAILPRAA
jgi:antitoxin HigA-1